MKTIYAYDYYLHELLCNCDAILSVRILKMLIIIIIHILSFFLVITNTQAATLPLSLNNKIALD